MAGHMSALSIQNAAKRFSNGALALDDVTLSLGDDGLMAPISEELPARTRLGLLLVCAAHMNNHIGQMSYLVQAQGHSTQEPPIW